MTGFVRRAAGFAVAAASVAALSVATLPFAPVAAAQTAPTCLPAPPARSTDVPWAQQQLQPQWAWPLTRGEGVVVAVVDSGVDASVPQLRGRVLRGVDVGTGGPADSDCIGHGTFVAGIIAAASRPDTGFAGIAPGAIVLPIRITRTAQSADIAPRMLAAGIRTAVDRGADVINVSASTTARSAELDAAVAYAADRDVVVVASSANGAQEGDPPTYPAAYPQVIAVGAVTVKGELAQFSQVGPHLDLAAPGVDVVSLGPGGPGQWQGSGTSYAAPFVSGTAALVRAYHPQLSAEQIAHRLEATAVAPAAVLPDPGLGWGVVDPAAAVSALLLEERGAGRPEPALAPVAPSAPDPIPALVTSVLGAVGAITAAGVTAATARLGTRGSRRGWRPARIHRNA
jgi:type VII secretion-associated serine protease mycosin